MLELRLVDELASFEIRGKKLEQSVAGNMDGSDEERSSWNEP